MILSNIAKLKQIDLIDYSTVPNCDLGANKRVGYYIGLFGYYIKNYFLFNNFF